MNKKVMILGASKPCCSSIKKAVLEGYDVVVADMYQNAPGFKFASKSYACDILDKEGILTICATECVDAIVPINDFGVPTAAYVANKLGLVGISEETALLATNKEKMRERWLLDGISCPVVELGTTFIEIKDAASRIGYPVVLKPAHGLGGGSRGVIVVFSEDELKDAVSFSQSFYDDKCTLIESYIDAVVEHSIDAIIHDGSINILAVSDKICEEFPYRISKCISYPTSTKGKMLDDIYQLVINSINSLGVNVGCAHVELAETRKGDLVMFELGARSGGGATPHPIISYTTGIDVISEYIRVMCGEEPRCLVNTMNRASCYYFLTPNPGKLRSVQGVEEVRQMNGVLEVDILVESGQEIMPMKEAKNRSGYIVTGSKTVARAVELAKEAEKKIVFLYEETEKGSVFK